MINQNNHVIENVKVYFDGSHFIAILPGFYKGKKKGKNKEYLVEVGGKLVDLKETFNEESKANKEKRKKERTKAVEEAMAPLFENSIDLEKFIAEQEERTFRNFVCRRKRLFRKVNLLFANYFCTFTYDSKKLTEEQFRRKLMQTLHNLSTRKGWKYIGVWEEGSENGRLHFHALLRIPEGQMTPGGVCEVRDYDTKNHKMQTAHVSPYFLDRFGRNDFSPIDKHVLNDAVMYMLKYLEKSGRRIVYARNVKETFTVDILVEDIACPYGYSEGHEEFEGKAVLFDNFLCLKNGEVLGTVSPDIILKLEDYE